MLEPQLFQEIRGKSYVGWDPAGVECWMGAVAAEDSKENQRVWDRENKSREPADETGRAARSRIGWGVV